MTGGVLWAAAPIALGNTLAALVGEYLVTRTGSRKFVIASMHDFLRLILLGGCAASLIPALTEATLALAQGSIGAGGYTFHLVRVWMGDVLGVILIAPLILLWWDKSNARAVLSWRSLEPLLLLGATLLFGQFIFLGWFRDGFGYITKSYWIFLFLTWIAVRLGIRGVTVALFMVSVQALSGAYLDVGYFQHDLANTQLTNFWFYMFTLSMVSMVLATFIADRKKLEKTLRESEKKFRQIFEEASDPALLLKDGRFIDCNAATLKLLGYGSKQAFINLSPAAASPPFQPDGRSSAEKSAEVDAAALREGTMQFEWLHCRADGSTVPVEVTLTPITMDGELIL